MTAIMKVTKKNLEELEREHDDFMENTLPLHIPEMKDSSKASVVLNYVGNILVYAGNGIGALVNTLSTTNIIKENLVNIVVLLFLIYIYMNGRAAIAILSQMVPCFDITVSAIKAILSHLGVKGVSFTYTLKLSIQQYITDLIIKLVTSDCCFISKESRRDLKSFKSVSTANGMDKSLVCSSLEFVTTSMGDLFENMLSIFSFVVTILNEGLAIFSNGGFDMDKFRDLAKTTKETVKEVVPHSPSPIKCFNKEIKLRRTLYLMSSDENVKKMDYFIGMTVISISAIFIIYKTVPGWFLLKTLLLNTVLSSLFSKNSNLFLYFCALRIFIAVSLCCLYHKYPSRKIIQLLTSSSVQSNIFLCRRKQTRTKESTQSGGYGFESLRKTAANTKRIVREKIEDMKKIVKRLQPPIVCLATKLLQMLHVTGSADGSLIILKSIAVSIGKFIEGEEIDYSETKDQFQEDYAFAVHASVFYAFSESFGQGDVIDELEIEKKSVAVAMKRIEDLKPSDATVFEETMMKELTDHYSLKQVLKDKSYLTTLTSAKSLSVFDIGCSLANILKKRVMLYESLFKYVDKISDYEKSSQTRWAWLSEADIMYDSWKQYLGSANLNDPGLQEFLQHIDEFKEIDISNKLNEIKERVKECKMCHCAFTKTVDAMKKRVAGNNYSETNDTVSITIKDEERKLVIEVSVKSSNGLFSSSKSVFCRKVTICKENKESIFSLKGVTNVLTAAFDTGCYISRTSENCLIST